MAEAETETENSVSEGEKHEQRSRSVSPVKSEEGSAKDDTLALLQSDSSDSETEGRKQHQSEEKTKKKREFKGDGVDKSLSELVKETAKKYPNKTGGNFFTGFDVNSKDAKKKSIERAKRFGIELPEKKSKTENLSSVVLPPGSTIGGNDIRFEAIFVSGVDAMSTQDVFNYFKEYDPSSIEWINDTSCNVVWLDPHSAARALFNMGQPSHIVPQPMRVPPPPPQPTPPPVREEQEPEPMEQEEEEDDDDFLDLVSDRETGEQERQRRSPSHSPNPNSPPPAPSSPSSSLQGRGTADDNNIAEDDMDMGPVHLSLREASRTTVPSPEAERELVIRYATTADKKVFDPQHRSQYYIKYGNPNFGGMKGLISKSLKSKIREGKFVPGQRKRRYGDDSDASDDDDRQEYARKRRNHGTRDDSSQQHQRMEEQDSDGDGVRTDLRLMTKSAELRRPMRMYADDLEDRIKTIRHQTTDTAPPIMDARERIKMNRPPATSRLGYNAPAADSSGSESDENETFPSGSIPNLKIMVSNDHDSWDEEEEEDDEDDQQTEPRSLQDLRSRLKNRHASPQFHPSLSIQVDRDDLR